MTRSMSLMALLALTTAPLTAQGEGQVGVPLGTVVEPVVIEDLDGNPFDLGQFIGKKPVLLQYWATWCPQCRALLPEMTRAHEQFGRQVEFLGIAVAVNQTPRRIKRHLEQHPMPFPIVYDSRGRATRALLAPATAFIAILDASGTVVYTGIGDDQKIVEALERLGLATDAGAGS